MISNSVMPNTYQYNIECTPFDFVLEDSDPETFNKDLTVPPDSYVIGDTVSICLGELSTVPRSAHPQVEFPTRGLERIRERQPSVIRRAKELRATLGDPLATLARVLQDIPVEDDVWDRIAQEPYG